MIETIRFILCLLCTIGGLFFLLTGVVGVFRFRSAMNRIHAAALGDTVGILLLIAGVIIAEGIDIATLKMILVIMLLWLSSPVGSHLIGKLEITTHTELNTLMEIDDPAYVKREKEGR